MGRKIILRDGDRIVRPWRMPPWLFVLLLVFSLISMISKDAPWFFPVVGIIAILLWPMKGETKAGLLLIGLFFAVVSYFS